MDNELLEIYNELEKITLKKINQGHKMSRNNFPTHRKECLGYVRQRFSGIIDLSRFTKNHPELCKLIFDYGKKICPFQFNSVELIKNLVCPPHKDKSNIGDSCIISFGNYEGCELVIEGNITSAKYKPILFNGYEKEHWNTPLISGTKYSLIFYNTKGINNYL